MATTPIYANGTWGRVVAVEHNGTRIDRPPDGQSPFEATWETTCQDHPEITKTVSGSCMLPNTDPRVMANRWPAWAALVANNTITEQMLATVSPPDSLLLQNAKASAFATILARLNSRLAAGIELEFEAGTRRLIGTSQASTALFMYASVTRAMSGNNPAAPLNLTDAENRPFASTLGELDALTPAYVQGIETLRGEYATLYATIDAAATVAQVTEIVEGL